MPLSFFNRFLIFSFFVAGVLPLRAQSTQTISKTDVQDMSIQGPQTDSPFFIERQEAQAALANAGKEGYGMYAPKPPRPPIQKQVKKFFQGMFASVKFHKNGDVLPLLLKVEPSQFSLATTPEIDVSLRVSNSQRQVIELLYPNDQRLEILVKDSNDTVISRWSEDRSFDQREGFVAINPAEYIIYSEKLGTSSLKAGETYTIEASLSGQEGYKTTTTITPQS